MTAVDFSVKSMTADWNEFLRLVVVVTCRLSPQSPCPKLDIGFGSIQSTIQPPVVDANYVPLTDGHDLEDQTFAG
jgi:hypothetical protein